MRLTIRSLVSTGACLGLAACLMPRVGVCAERSAGRRLDAQCREVEGQPGGGSQEREHQDRSRRGRHKFIVDQTLADGSTRHWEFTANYDGKDSPVTGNNPDADTVARTRINATTVQTIAKKDGKVTTTQTSAVSSDGKTRTVTTKGVNASGQQVNNVAVYEKQ